VPFGPQNQLSCTYLRNQFLDMFEISHKVRIREEYIFMKSALYLKKEPSSEEK